MQCGCQVCAKLSRIQNQRARVEFWMKQRMQQRTGREQLEERVNDVDSQVCSRFAEQFEAHRAQLSG